VVKTDKQGATNTTDYDDYRDVDGIRFPYHINTDQGPVNLNLTVQSIKVNAGLSDSEFK
jgi:hypothetical protein